MRVWTTSPLRNLDCTGLELVLVVIDNIPQCVGLTLCDLLSPNPMGVLRSDFGSDRLFDLLVSVGVGDGTCGNSIDDVSDAGTCLGRHG